MRWAIRAALGSVLVSVITATAASLGGVNAPSLGAGGSGVSPCDTNGVTVTYTTQSGKVSAVTVGGIADPSCEGAAVSVTLVDGGGSAIGNGGPQTVAADGDTSDDSVSVTVSPQPSASSVQGVHVVIVGP